MQISYDTEADAMYIRFRHGQFVRNTEVAEGIILDIGNGVPPFIVPVTMRDFPPFPRLG